MKNLEPGAPFKDFIPLSVPSIEGNEWKYLKECLSTNWVSSAGPFVEKFEEAIANYLGIKYAIATINGTSALHIALKLSRIEEGDEVIVSDLTFVAPANAIKYLGAFPVFIDAEEKYFQMDIQKLEDFIKKECQFKNGFLVNKHTKRKIRAILPVHILGGVCEIEKIMELAKNYGLEVIEDSTECLGAKYKNKFAGTFGKIGVLSFNGNKIITTGAGGMIITNDENIAKKARYLTTQAKDDPVEFIHNEIGYNYRMPNICAALGLAQLENLEKFIERKRKIAKKYNNEFKKLDFIKTPEEAPETFNTFWLYTIYLKEKSPLNRTALMKKLEEKKIQTRPLWQPMHLLPYFNDCYYTDCSISEKLKKNSLSLPCSVNLKTESQEYVIEQILKILK